MMRVLPNRAASSKVVWNRSSAPVVVSTVTCRLVRWVFSHSSSCWAGSMIRHVCVDSRITVPFSMDRSSAGSPSLLYASGLLSDRMKS